METQEIQDVAGLLGVLKELKGVQSIFRGVRSDNHELMPTIGRTKPLGNQNRKEMESRLFRKFKERSLPHLTFVPRDDWEWLATAQHHGLSTRLLDWSTNPLVAAYFAIEREQDGASAIYACEVRDVVDTLKEPDPFKVPSVKRYRPPAITERIIRQAGLFTVHPAVDEAYNPPSLRKITIPTNHRRSIKQELFKLGISRGALFPGLDGVASDVTWEGTGTY